MPSPRLQPPQNAISEPWRAAGDAKMDTLLHVHDMHDRRGRHAVHSHTSQTTSQRDPFGRHTRTALQTRCIPAQCPAPRVHCLDLPCRKGSRQDLNSEMGCNKGGNGGGDGRPARGQRYTSIKTERRVPNIERRAEGGAFLKVLTSTVRLICNRAKPNTQ